ncbi:MULTISPECIES: uroporphyrinogen-III C-methyltransferase [Leptospira]|uniref:uroporphyrinogen-III C-methyltransferase n=1 Tax=Leptospira kirschneri serovar Pomona TaxID=561005 RepID=A0A1T1DRF9_9LEPT|nr:MULTISPECIES: uroporphyrinogen-III C-methyltransferase [Leptospira]EKP03688.1 uroporphyrinogen-III C-methyltransferase [Leptospira kirschneri str. 2008720114]EKQ83786.1 uroporphyrinogen-III C-methyltransferase [Leptospira kirschneri serovar Grippotyphosa str. Moskva]EKR08813.1 uroporphyrinogen-III C-methyltransferase [Leptospira kirschneri serovar Valbuzzi str. 200702274]EMK07819.1 uroporphyrinogen-III C-methyltransferase [Leptospira kirschneri]EMO69450.1 uroporphyrinogen-III C-methyltransf
MLNADTNKNFCLGKVYLVGAGPGNPEDLTLRAYRILTKAEVILYDALLDPSFLEIFPKSAIVHYVGKRSGAHSATQQEINELLLSYALQGKNVVRLKGGDPFVFGRGGEELITLVNHNIKYEIVPGVSSLNAGSSFAGFPLTHRGLSRQVLIMDGHTVLNENTDWEWFAKFQGTIALFMGTSSLPKIADLLLKHGSSADLPVALVENASLENCNIQVCSLKEAANSYLEKKTKGPGIIYIGKVVRFLENKKPTLTFSQFSKESFLGQISSEIQGGKNEP